MARKSPEEEAKEARDAKRAMLIVLILGPIAALGWLWLSLSKAVCFGSC